MLNLKLIYQRKIFLTISIVLTMVGLIFWFIFGLRYGIEFTGGSLMEVKFNADVPGLTLVKDAVKQAGLKNDPIVQITDNGGAIIRFQESDEASRKAVFEKLQIAFPKISQEKFDSIGPSIGNELRTKAIYSIFIVVIAIILYIAWAFRKVSYPVQSWKYGVAAVVALIHDILITVGVFAFLGKFAGVEVDIPFIAALLTILGYSVNDTIVVFDRIRENLGRVSKVTFEEVVNRSVNETMARSINTTLTTLLALIAVYFFGGVSVQYFALALIIGIFCGAYSSIFIASPILVIWERLSRNK